MPNARDASADAGPYVISSGHAGAAIADIGITATPAVKARKRRFKPQGMV